MKTIGIIGGMSFESTITYYKTINETINNQLGNLNSAKILLYSVNFEEIANLQKNGEWEKAAQILGECAKKLELGGADFILIATNTMCRRKNKISIWKNKTSIKVEILFFYKA
ncbi:aspartate/glutamate racemase family protein [Campylobacter coli]|nr:aspartate/glutamate racemase family protein [Campylobacter coli]